MRVKIFAVMMMAALSTVATLPVGAEDHVFLDSSTLKNDLSGSLTGSVKFAQTHTIDPNNNSQQEMPRLVSTRDTLVMLILDRPAESIGMVVKNRAGTVLGQVEMNPPDQLPSADRPTTSANPDVIYSDKAWSQILPADWVQPGMSIEFSDPSTQESGQLNNIDVGGETQVVLQNIRIGMLTEPVALDYNLLEKTSQTLAEDYFQKIPVSELIVGNYAPLYLNEVVLSSGKKYTTSSDSNGGVYSGDMREDIAKGLISMGIDNANFGINSSKGGEQWQPGLFHQVAIHLARGKYKNGIVEHGLSGGNGMATLFDTVGNEFSHELGHGYGLGHYPGGKKWSTHSAHSGWGWGWDRIRNRFVANFFWDKKEDTAEKGDGDPAITQPFLGIYKFNRDAMGGGVASSTLSHYTLHTGYSQKLIQRWLEAKAVITPLSASGYLIWNEQQKTMVKAEGDLYRKPDAFGVPVVTLVGYYDPHAVLNSYIYPALHGSYGYTYKPMPLTKGQCWVEVNYADGEPEKFGIDGMQLQEGHMNKFHINVPESKKPTAVRVACPQKNMSTTEFMQWKLQQLDTTQFFDWSKDKDQPIGSIYFYPEKQFYFRLKNKPYWYFPTIPVDNRDWEYLTDEASLKKRYQSTPATSQGEYILAQRNIEPVRVKPTPPAKVGYLSI